MSQVFGPAPPPPNTDTSLVALKLFISTALVIENPLACLNIPKLRSLTIIEKSTAISVHMGIPLLTRKTGYVDPRWSDKKPHVDYASPKSPTSNIKALCLNLRADIKHEEC
ncbi:uncharacterized protein Bfra_007171 [Botrytis fragariae]|uniref:Uncharacterized protein n=1 Tax=Botrytis fragariae TaxID=1964551 RepID=A0A8H6EDK1_9HELO|nr:uncharacterized protein Bfra_007171 [Botrytis fragariae]KAF5867975.1 hypothetical protein Bfra_007171 [Botrytis fragariae]